MAAKRKTPPAVVPYGSLGREKLQPVLARLARLGLRPPQTLLIEGGLPDERLDLAKYWVAAANCEKALEKKLAGEPPAPCLACNTCQQVGANEFMDFSIYDGRIGNKEDETDPGPVKALNMRRVRELKSMLAVPPHGSGKRGIVLMGLPVNRDNAANALLKALEEPARDTLFILLCPQRQQLLPTLVSRSFVLTIPWDNPHRREAIPFEDELVEFLASGRNFLDCVGAKGGVDLEMAEEIVLGCRKAMLRVLSGEVDGMLEKSLVRAAKPETVATVSRWLAEAQEMLQYSVAPARVLEGLFTKIFCFLH